MKAIEAAMLQDEKIFLVTQKDPEMETPGITGSVQGWYSCIYQTGS